MATLRRWVVSNTFMRRQSPLRLCRHASTGGGGYFAGCARDPAGPIPAAVSGRAATLDQAARKVAVGHGPSPGDGVPGGVESAVESGGDAGDVEVQLAILVLGGGGHGGAGGIGNVVHRG